MTPTFAAIELIATDMGKTLDFYRELGLEIPAEADSAPHAEYKLPGGITLMWDSVEMMRTVMPGWVEPIGEDRLALAFDCHTPAGVDETYRRLTDLGHLGSTAPWDTPWGQRYATIEDPDGRSIDLFAPLDSTQ
ncbi:MAG: glyoxalase [Rhodococcus sp.]|nr:glyoxalase [Rhodococcus sp. (in: high G+C Gram-positive bacteria)]